MRCRDASLLLVLLAAPYPVKSADDLARDPLGGAGPAQCPMLACAAPRDGCQYVTTQDVDSVTGCPTDCGTLECTTCPTTQVFNQCGSACPATCGDTALTMCTQQCVTGCGCATGESQLTSAAGDFTCVKECPAITPRPTPSTICPQSQVWKECETACPLECGKEAPMMCTEQCIIGCGCADGESRLSSDLGFTCVKECPTSTPPPVDCALVRCASPESMDCSTAGYTAQYPPAGSSDCCPSCQPTTCESTPPPCKDTQRCVQTQVQCVRAPCPAIITCEDSTAAPTYNCQTKEVWPAAKTEWCCANRQMGCTSTPRPTKSSTEPCMVVDCAPGFVLDGFDSRGCGGTCQPDCSRTLCAPLTCTNAVTKGGECCPTCPSLPTTCVPEFRRGLMCNGRSQKVLGSDGKPLIVFHGGLHSHMHESDVTEQMCAEQCTKQQMNCCLVMWNGVCKGGYRGLRPGGPFAKQMENMAAALPCKTGAPTPAPPMPTEPPASRCKTTLVPGKTCGPPRFTERMQLNGKDLSVNCHGCKATAQDCLDACARAGKSCCRIGWDGKCEGSMEQARRGPPRSWVSVEPQCLIEPRFDMELGR